MKKRQPHHGQDLFHECTERKQTDIAKELEKKTEAQDEGVLQQGNIADSKQQLINMIQSSQNKYFIQSVLIYARCLDRTLKKI